MNEKLIESLTNPVKAKLLSALRDMEQATAKQLADRLPEIPPATLYRHLKRFTQHGLIKVVEEHKVRGTLERVYALSVELPVVEGDLPDGTSPPAIARLFSDFMMGIMGEFQTYLKSEGADPAADRIGFSTAPVHATDAELDEAGKELAAVIQRLAAQAPAPGRKLRSVAVIITPPKTGQGDAS